MTSLKPTKPELSGVTLSLGFCVWVTEKKLSSSKFFHNWFREVTWSRTAFWPPVISCWMASTSDCTCAPVFKCFPDCSKQKVSVELGELRPVVLPLIVSPPSALYYSARCTKIQVLPPVTAQNNILITSIIQYSSVSLQVETRNTRIFNSQSVKSPPSLEF